MLPAGDDPPIGLSSSFPSSGAPVPRGVVFSVLCVILLFCLCALPCSPFMPRGMGLF